MGCVKKISVLTRNRFPGLSTRGIDIEDLVRFVLLKRSMLKDKATKKNGDDVRDYIDNSFLLQSLSSKTLTRIIELNDEQIRSKLKNREYPFSPLTSKKRDKLMHLPPSWIRGSAKWLLDNRGRYIEQTVKPT